MRCSLLLTAAKILANYRNAGKLHSDRSDKRRAGREARPKPPKEEETCARNHYSRLQRIRERGLQKVPCLWDFFLRPRILSVVAQFLLP